MRALLARHRDMYGSHPLHLMLMLAGFAVLGYLIVTFGPAAFWNSKVWWQSIVVWFVAAIVLHDLVLYPAYALGDRVLSAADGALRRRGEQPAMPALNYLRIPTLASTLLLLLFLPGIIKQGARTHLAATGLDQQPYLGRWLLLTAAFFAVSALVYVIGRARRRGR